MSIKKRITVAVAIICLIPVLLITLTCRLIIQYHMESIATVYNVETDTVTVLQNPMLLYANLTKQIYFDLQNVTLYDQEKLADSEYLEEVNQQLKNRYSFLVIRKGADGIAYCGNWDVFSQMKNNLPDFGNSYVNGEIGLYVSGNYPTLLKQLDYMGTDGVPCSLFIITDVNNLLPQVKDFAVQVVISFLLILLLTAMLLIVWLYQSIARPLGVLRMAANLIAEGNLDYAIPVRENDEIGQLQKDFEVMRIHLKDMSDQQIAYEQASRTMLSNVTHDLKTPLTAIKGYAEGLIDGVADTPEKTEKYLKTIYAKACAMEQLVDELSFFSKIDNDRMLYNFQAVPVKEYLLDCIDEVSLDLEVKGIALHFSCGCGDDVKAIIDPEQIRRVINNIIGNSVKYMDKEKGEITIRVLCDADMVWITVEDNGSGIKKKDLPHIFDRFYRGDTARGTKKGGSGLGLSIVKSIVKDHGGAIEADSVEGKGTAIRFSVPRQRNAAPEEVDKEAGKRKLWIKS